MSKESVESINAVHKIGVPKSILKSLIMDFKCKGKLTQEETESLITKYKLRSS